jgi:hypothetical protein
MERTRPGPSSLVLLSLLFIPLSRSRALAQDAAFTYQGQLKKSGALVSATCSFRFGLWDAAVNGNQQGIYDTQSVPVSNGLFSVVLNASGHLGTGTFPGGPRWLDIAVQCPPDPGYTSLGRVAVEATPYAIGLAPGTNGTSETASITHGSVLKIENGSSVASDDTYAVVGRKGAGAGFASTAAAVWGDSDASGIGVFATSPGAYAIRAIATVGDGVYGSTAGLSPGLAGVRGVAFTESGITQSFPAGVVGDSSLVAYGVAGYTNSGTGVYGDNGNSNSSGHAGYFRGRVTITGNLTVNGTFSNPSDATLKTDVAPLSYGIEELLQVKPVSWRWGDRPGEGRRVGVVAQDLERVLPDLVVHDCDPDAPLGVDTLGLVPVLVRALQQEDARVRQLEERLLDLEARLDTR